MNRAEIARRQRCRALELAAVLGVLLAVFAAVSRTWPTVAIGLAGAGLLLLVRRRTCRGLDSEPST